MSRVEELKSALAEHGLRVRGHFTPQSEDQLPDLVPSSTPKTLILVGNIGSSIWPSFSASREFSDKQAHPLDRWSQRIADQLAADCMGIALFPFDGPPYWPFLAWTQRAEGLTSSPLGLRFHPKYGLWHAYRFALLLPFVFDEKTEVAQRQASKWLFDCTSCGGQPCLHSCPVKAFDGINYDTGSCADYLNNNSQASCNSEGCLARHACPVGHEFAYRPEHANFHMQAFITARSRVDQP